MTNIILDEKRFMEEGEIVAVELKNLEGYRVIKNFGELLYVSSNLGIEEGITFMKYLGNGKLLDLVSEQLIRIVTINADDFGTDEYKALTQKSQYEIMQLSEGYRSIISPKDNEEVLFNYNMFLNNPLAIEIDSAPFMKIDSEVLRKFANQDLAQLKSKVSLARTKALQNLKVSCNENFDFIDGFPKQKKIEIV